MKRLVSTFLLCYSKFTLATNGCEINPAEHYNSPLIIRPDSNELIYPKPGEKTVKFHQNEEIYFACPQNDSPNPSRIEGKAICESGTNFKTETDYIIDWAKSPCNNKISISMQYTRKDCGPDGKEIKVGFDVQERGFISTMTICFDARNLIAHYSFTVLKAAGNGGLQKSMQRNMYKWFKLDLISDIYGNISIDSLYKEKKQRSTINKLLGLPEDSTDFIKDKSTPELYLARGHLTANADMFYPAERRSTFFIGNAVPQWQLLNNKNWKRIEESIRKYGEESELDLKVWTGIYGVASSPHKQNKKETKLYLYVNDDRKALPVPAHLWKVVYNPKSHLSVVFVGVNNPYITNYVPICENVTDKLGVEINHDYKNQGLCYACTFESFKEKVKITLDIDHRGLLIFKKFPETSNKRDEF
ncbi:salivary endonuclease-like [Rhynchophorus ferrugineus]|uniref:salivary endonuclease-like n=1 Tax=Rhynchophorus ferrugineus TaxID=354439 RepID=UPI003FCDD071